MALPIVLVGVSVPISIKGVRLKVRFTLVATEAGLFASYYLAMGSN